MKRAFLLICLGLSTISSAVCQTNASITDVDFRIENNNIVVVYNITGYQPLESFVIGLSFQTGDFKSIYPVSVYGDIGPGITGGTNKSIVWNIVQDNLVLTGNLKAVVSILSASFIQVQPSGKPLYQPAEKPLGGPGYAFLSMILPGTGGYFVERNKQRAIAYNVIGGAVLASVIVHYVKLQDLNDQFDAATTSASKSDIQGQIDETEKTLKTAGTVYAIIWVTDVLWVTIKGSKNMAERKKQGSGFTLNYMDNHLMTGYRLRF